MLALRTAARSLAAALSLALVTSGCLELEGLDKPVPPEAPASVSSLDEPSGMAGTVPFSEVVASLQASAGTYDAACGWEPVADADCLVAGTCAGCQLTDVFFDLLRDLLPSLQGEADGGVDSIDGVNGYVQVVRLCPGFGAPTPDPANGRIELNAGFTGHGLDPVAWGSVEGCQLSLGGRLFTVDGDLGFFYPERVPFELLLSTRVAFAFTGTVVEGPTTFPVTLALRLRPDLTGEIELLVDLGPQGTFVVVISPLGVFLRAKDGYFQCNVVTETCTAI